MLAVDSSSSGFVDRTVGNTKNVAPYDLLPLRNTFDKTQDPEVKNYFIAKQLYQQGYDLCLSIPRKTDEETVNKYEKEIRKAAETLVDAWLMDDRATPMTERILSLGQQYELVLLKNIPEELKDSYYVKHSLLFSSWILLVGFQYKACLDTISLAIATYQELPPRVFCVRASCYFALLEEGFIAYSINDLQYCLERDPQFYPAHFILGCVYIACGNERDNAIKSYETYLRTSDPSSLDTVQSLYALSILYHHKGKASLATTFYEKAVAAEEEFTKIYGTHTGLSSLKRAAIILHENSNIANTLIAKYTPNNQYDKIIQELIDSGEIKLSYPPDPTQCSACGTKEKPLLACGGCTSIWYCSRECQIADYRKTHKEKCASMRNEQQQ